MSCLHSYLSFKLSVRDKTSNWWIFPNTNLEHTPHKYLQQILNDIFHTFWEQITRQGQNKVRPKVWFLSLIIMPSLSNWISFFGGQVERTILTSKRFLLLDFLCGTLPSLLPHLEGGWVGGPQQVFCVRPVGHRVGRLSVRRLIRARVWDKFPPDLWLARQKLMFCDPSLYPQRGNYYTRNQKLTYAQYRDSDELFWLCQECPMPPSADASYKISCSKHR